MRPFLSDRKAGRASRVIAAAGPLGGSNLSLPDDAVPLPSGSRYFREDP